VKGHVLARCEFGLPTLNRELVALKVAKQQFFQRRLDQRGGDGVDWLEEKCVGGCFESPREAIIPQTKEVLSQRAKMTWNQPYCQRSFNPARETCDVKSLGFDRFVALSAQLHEYSRTTRFATDSVAFTVE
tara:strand:- start:176 stop:568 length:393 start_codon:yes stop_codon:yes gene_type:complete